MKFINYLKSHFFKKRPAIGVCPNCGNTITLIGSNCPYCSSPIKHTKFSRRIYILIAAIPILILCILPLINNSIKSRKLIEQYNLPIHCHQKVLGIYGENIKLDQAYLFNYDGQSLYQAHARMSSSSTDNTTNEDFEWLTSFEDNQYIYFEYDFNPDGVKQTKVFIFKDGKMMWESTNTLSDDPVSNFNNSTASLYKEQFQLVLIIAQLTQPKTFEELQQNKPGICALDIDLIEKNSI